MSDPEQVAQAAADAELRGQVITVDSSSGEVHLRYARGDRLLVDEACNLDQAGAYTIAGAGELVGVPARKFCGRCFPRMHDGEPES